MEDRCNALTKETKDNGNYDYQDVINCPQGTEVQLASGKNMLNFSTSNYLGLANHPRINQKAKDTIDEYGFGMASVRRVCGTISIHK